MLQTFLPLFAMTFVICLFIVLMQFVWRYIDDLVGKGLEVSLIAELFWYAALSMVPMALPLAILLASLMTFGNLGEHFELTAMKSSGVSLIRVMSPLILLLVFVAIGAFFFQNNVLPVSQVKMYSLLYSMRQKSPELDIPESTFYDGIEGYNLYVKSKDRESGLMHDVMIYDVSGGYGYANVIVADSGRLSFTEDKLHLFMELMSGESMEDLKDDRSKDERSGMLYRRESFQRKEIMIPFDATFTRMDDESMRSQYVGKNLSQLSETIDSLETRIDSLGDEFHTSIKGETLMGLAQRRIIFEGDSQVTLGIKEVEMPVALNVDSIFNASTELQKISYVETAKTRANRLKQNMEFRSTPIAEESKLVRRHQIEMQKKFTLSFACLIFFFIGAPLGAIIRKGGLGTPIVVSVLLFIVYYIIDNMGYKLAREGRWAVWQGIWLSSEVLLPLGIWLTYKAVNDSAVFNPDAYRNMINRLTGRQKARLIEMKELIMYDLGTSEAITLVKGLDETVAAFERRHKHRQDYITFWTRGYDAKEIGAISDQLEQVVERLSNSDSRLVINKLMDYPFIRNLITYHPTNGNSKVGIVIAILLPIGALGYVIGSRSQNHLKRDLKTIRRVNDELLQIFER